MKINKKEVGKRIHSLRESKNLSMEALAKLIGAGGKSTVNTWEKGVTLPRERYIKSLANALNVSIEYLEFGSLQHYLESLVLADISSEDSVLDAAIEQYLDVNTDYLAFKNGFPVGHYPKGTTFEDIHKAAKESELMEILSENYKDISKWLGHSLRYNNDAEILEKLKTWFISGANAGHWSFMGLSRLMRDGLEKWMPATMGMENDTVKEIKKDKTDYRSEWPDEKILDGIYQSKLMDWQIDALQKLSQLQDEYQKQLNELKQK